MVTVEASWRSETPFPDGLRRVDYLARTWDQPAITREVTGLVVGIEFNANRVDSGLPKGDPCALIEVAVPISATDTFRFGAITLRNATESPALSVWVEPDEGQPYVTAWATAPCLIDHTQVRDVADLNEQIHRWHDDDHADPFTVCQHPVCRSMRETW